ncbi:MAG: DUF979 domain-containing protein [Opitutus sp.]|nr:DUF979 domain-containing protein [Opitutus sp.]
MTTWLTLENFFVLAGAFVVALGVRIATDVAHPKRWGSAVFWLLLGACIIAGKRLPAEAIGYAVLVMTALAATKQVVPPHFDHGDEAELTRRATTLGGRLLWPVLLVPLVAVTGGFLLGKIELGGALVALPAQASQVSLGIGGLLALALAFGLTRERPVAAVDEGGRLLQLISWTLILPQMLAALGGIFAKAGVGDEVAKIVAALLPVQHPLVAVIAYCAGMALFTIMMGNAFAAFPVMTLGVGLPFIVQAHGGNPAVMGALGMLSGYCGTLLTPMAANFNLVPVRLLELRDDHAVIRAQAPFAAAIWIFNVAVMYFCVYRFSPSPP